jgi:hypothetical protein
MKKRISSNAVLPSNRNLIGRNNAGIYKPPIISHNSILQYKLPSQNVVKKSFKKIKRVGYV